MVLSSLALVQEEKTNRVYQLVLMWFFPHGTEVPSLMVVWLSAFDAGPGLERLQVQILGQDLLLPYLSLGDVPEYFGHWTSA